MISAPVTMHRCLVEKNKLIAADAQHVEGAFQAKLATFGTPAADALQAAGKTGLPRPLKSQDAGKPKTRARSKVIDKSVLTLPEPRRIRDRDHVKFVAQRPCLICGRRPSDTHHLRFAQSRALGRKVSDEFTVPLCRGHHREVHRCGGLKRIRYRQFRAKWASNASVVSSSKARITKQSQLRKSLPVTSLRQIDANRSSPMIAR
jgi:hypothetical protein